MRALDKLLERASAWRGRMNDRWAQFSSNAGKVHDRLVDRVAENFWRFYVSSNVLVLAAAFLAMIIAPFV